MRFRDRLQAAAQARNSLLCVGLDPDPERLPDGVARDRSGLLAFCCAVVAATADLVCAYKPQVAYFSAVGAERELERLIAYVRQAAPDVPVILDAKRGDIGNTARQYAREAFERYGADAVTLSPFMGQDSLEPYLRYPDKGLFLLCRTSNPGGSDLQQRRLADVAGQPLLFEHVAALAAGPWNTQEQLGLVVGATYPAELARVRALAPTLPLLIPGVGAQGGDAAATVRAALSQAHDAPVAINSARAILYADGGRGFADAARQEAMRLRDQFNAARASCGAAQAK